MDRLYDDPIGEDAKGFGPAFAKLTVRSLTRARPSLEGADTSSRSWSFGSRP
jgi:hypothetical protein